MDTSRPGTRRRFILGTTAAAGAWLAAPALLRSGAHAADEALAPYLEAKINWRQCEGESLNVAIIPASFFKPLISHAAEFQALTGIKAGFEEIPPGQIRNKTVLDLTSKTGTYSTSFTDPMYYPLYASNKWVEPLAEYLGDSSLTDAKWYDVDDVVPAWRSANTYENKLYGMPFDGEATVQVYRTDLYAAKGLKPAQTLDEYTKNAAALNDPPARLWGAALRGFPGPGQNMYIYPSIFLAFGGKWFDAGGKLKVNGPEAEAALAWYVSLDNKYAPKGVENWNWPDIADAFSQGTLGSYIDGAATASVLADPQKSKVIGKMDFTRWPAGPSGRRVTSIWNWGFVMNGALTKKAKQATWLFIQWATSHETQMRTSVQAGQTPRLGVSRLSVIRSPEYKKITDGIGPNFVSAYLDSMAHDTDPDWRPRVPQWPAVGETMSVAIQQALSGQATPKAALDNAQARIEQIMRA